MKKAKNIEWEIEMEEVYEMLDNLPYEKSADILEIPKDTYTNMTTEERHDYAYDKFRHCPGYLYDVLNLPEEVDVYDEIEEDDVADYISDIYGYCIKSLRIINDVNLGTFSVDVLLQPDGKFDVYVGHEGSSGLHYTDVTADYIGALLAEEIERIKEANVESHTN